jgi:RimJ/RimL family protein N-acetyltransferase
LSEARLSRIVTDTERISLFVAGILGIEPWSQCRAIGLEKDGKLVAGVVYDYYTGANICLHIAAVPGRRWLTKEFLWFMFFYPFEQLGVKRITGIIPESNVDSRKFAQGLHGATLEARLKDAHPDGDMLIFRMFKEDCMYLRIKNGKG